MPQLNVRFAVFIDLRHVPTDVVAQGKAQSQAATTIRESPEGRIIPNIP